MTCKEFIDFLIDYYDGNLSQEEREKFDAHIEVCPDCVAYLESYKSTVSLVKQTHADSEVGEDIEVPASLVNAILAVQEK